MHPAKRRFAGPATALAAAAALALTAAAPALATAPAQAGQETRRSATVPVSVTPNGAQANSQAQSGAVSADGRSAVFTSAATDLVAQPSKGGTDAFLRDLGDGRTERVDLSDDGSALSGVTVGVAVSADGRYVAFDTTAANVVPGAPAPGRENVYVRDRLTGHTRLVSAPQGTPDPDPGHSASAPSMSADGRYVAYVSDRTDLVPAAAPAPAPAATTTDSGERLRLPNYDSNVYLTDLWTHTTRVVSATAAGAASRGQSVNPTISADGRTVGFSSNATDLGVTGAPAHRADPAPSPASGRMRAGTYYTYDVRSHAVLPVSYDPAGQVSPDATLDATLSPSGRYAVYGLTVPVGAPGGDRYQDQLFARDLHTGVLIPLTAGLPGTVSTATSDSAQVTGDDHWAYFDSSATNLVPGAQHEHWDVYRYDLRTGRVERVSDAADGSLGNGDSTTPHVDAHGGTVLFESTSRNLVAGPSSPPAPADHQVFARRPAH
ncbi:hypothetical protein ACFXPX_41435 [Kitasatospora sp. NPDC059146]|uniref:hypothetical protein n=1 Tax=Kitasatospora sp. NPDC059146 TaxID=3346741 RepID=UPI0036A52281